MVTCSNLSYVILEIRMNYGIWQNNQTYINISVWQKMFSYPRLPTFYSDHLALRATLYIHKILDLRMEIQTQRYEFVFP